jgi:predicted glycoside hydrolase/deacetylase ChbG (UPF0249 family)
MSSEVHESQERSNGTESGVSVDSGAIPCASTNRPNAVVIINADDWGHDDAATGRALNCVLYGAVSSVSAMVFMEDSERAAELARHHGVDAGLHLNLTEPFHVRQSGSQLSEHLEKISRFLISHRFAPVLYRPDLVSSFEYVVRTQLDEYERLYGAPAQRIDGHLHMHLCTNVVYRNLLPRGVIVRRNFTFSTAEKGILNRVYRNWQDRQLAQRYRMADFFFDLLPLNPSRIEKIFALGTSYNVEVEVHPVKDDQYAFLTGSELAGCSSGVKVARGYNLRCFDQTRQRGSSA